MPCAPARSPPRSPDEWRCGQDEVRTVHQFALLRFLGCTSDAAETAAMVGGDDAGLQRRDGSGDHGLGLGDHGTPRAQRRPRPAPDAASPARRPRARRSEGRSALPGDALRGGGHAGRTRRHRAAGRRRARPCLRALGWEGVSRPGSRETRFLSRCGSLVVARDADLATMLGADPREWMRERRGRAYDPSVVDAFERGGVAASSPSSAARTSGRPLWRPSRSR